MKIAFAGKGGVGKTTLAAWTGEYLARRGETVWLIDADTALSLGQAAGVAKEDLPAPLISRQDLIEERIGSGLIHLNPMVTDLAEQLAVEVPGTWVGRQRLLVMGTVTNAGGGCACGANALLKALLAHIITESQPIPFYPQMPPEVCVQRIEPALNGQPGGQFLPEPRQHA